jgi:hypothetical protein
MFQICVLDQKIQEKNRRYVFEFFSKCNDQEHQNMIFKNIIEISKSMEPNNVLNFFIL